MGDLEDATEYMIRVVLIADDYNRYQGYDIPSAILHTKCESKYSLSYLTSLNVSIHKTITNY